jgi:hypothetical protein
VRTSPGDLPTWHTWGGGSLDDERHDEAETPAADESPSIVDRVRANIGETPADEAPFNRGTLSAWLGEADPPSAPASSEPFTLTSARRRTPDDKTEDGGRRGRFDRRLLLVSAVAVLLAVGILATSALALVNAQRAKDWESRAEQIQVRTKIINDLLVERSHDVNARTRALNASAAQLRRTKRALARSEADVRALVRRQTELANEKAQAEDARRLGR